MNTKQKSVIVGAVVGAALGALAGFLFTRGLEVPREEEDEGLNRLMPFAVRETNRARFAVRKVPRLLADPRTTEKMAIALASAKEWEMAIELLSREGEAFSLDLCAPRAAE